MAFEWLQQHDMDPNGDDWWWIIMAYEWPFNDDDNDVVDDVFFDEDDDDHDVVNDVLIDVDVDDVDVDDYDDAMYDVLNVGIHLSSTTFEWP